MISKDISSFATTSILKSANNGKSRRKHFHGIINRQLALMVTEMRELTNYNQRLRISLQQYFQISNGHILLHLTLSRWENFLLPRILSKTNKLKLILLPWKRRNEQKLYFKDYKVAKITIEQQTEVHLIKRRHSGDLLDIQLNIVYQISYRIS